MSSTEHWPRSTARRSTASARPSSCEGPRKTSSALPPPSTAEPRRVSITTLPRNPLNIAAPARPGSLPPGDLHGHPGAVSARPGSRGALRPSLYLLGATALLLAGVELVLLLGTPGVPPLPTWLFTGAAAVYLGAGLI